MTRASLETDKGCVVGGHTHTILCLGVPAWSQLDGHMTQAEARAGGTRRAVRPIDFHYLSRVLKGWKGRYRT